MHLRLPASFINHIVTLTRITSLHYVPYLRLIELIALLYDSKLKCQLLSAFTNTINSVSTSHFDNSAESFPFLWACAGRAPKWELIFYFFFIY